MERSTQERPRIQEIADRIAARFVAFPVVAAATTIYWLRRNRRARRWRWRCWS
jgi:cation transport ATPase